MREREGRQTERGKTIVRSMIFNIFSTSQDHLRTKWKERERDSQKKTEWQTDQKRKQDRKKERQKQ